MVNRRRTDKTTQWPNEKDKQQSTKHQTENLRSSNMKKQQYLALQLMTYPDTWLITGEKFVGPYNCTFFIE